MSLRVILYLRVSTEDQAENGTSLEFQRERLLDKAESIGAEVMEIYSDEGVSGQFYKTRPGIQAALADIEEGKANILLAYELSRLSRDLEHQIVIKKRVEAANARLLFVKGEYSNDEEGELMFSVEGSFKAYERKLIRRRTMDGKKKRARDGSMPNRVHSPYGYHIVTKEDVLTGKYPANTDGKYMLMPAEAEIVSMIFNWYAEGKSQRQITKLLEQAGVKTAKGLDSWQQKTIQGILSNPTYKGCAVFGKTRTVTDETRIEKGYRKRSKQIDVPEDSWTYIEVEPIVTPEIWKVCQDRLENNKERLSGNGQRKHYLSGILKCPTCGLRMSYGSNSANRDRYYACNGKICKKRWYAVGVENAVKTILCELSSSDVENAVRSYREAEPKGFDPAILERLQKELAALEKREKIVADEKIEAKIEGRDGSVFASKLAEISKQKETLSTKIKELEDLRSNPPIPENTPAVFVRACQQVLNIIESENYTPVEKYEVLSNVFSEIVPSGMGFSIKTKSLCRFWWNRKELRPVLDATPEQEEQAEFWDSEWTRRIQRRKLKGEYVIRTTLGR